MEKKDRLHITIDTYSVIKVILILLAIYVGFLLRNMLLTLLAAVVLASAIEPIAKWFIEKKWPRVLSVLSIYAVIAGILVGGFYFLFLPFMDQAIAFVRDLPEIVKSIETVRPAVPVAIDSGVSAMKVAGPVGDSLPFTRIIEEWNTALAEYSGGLFTTIMRVFGGLFGFVLIIVVSFYLAMQEKGVEHFLETVTPPAHTPYVVSLWNRAEKKIGLWLQGQLLLVLIIGVLVYLGLLLLGVRNALLLAVLAGALELIPVFGPIIAAIPAIMIAFVDGGITPALLVFGLYVIVQQFENQLIYPLVVKKVVGISPVVVILALVAGGTLAGFLGIILAVPLAAVIVEFMNDIHSRKKA